MMIYLHGAFLSALLWCLLGLRKLRTTELSVLLGCLFRFEHTLPLSLVFTANRVLLGGLKAYRFNRRGEVLTVIFSPK